MGNLQVVTLPLNVPGTIDMFSQDDIEGDSDPERCFIENITK